MEEGIDRVRGATYQGMSWDKKPRGSDTGYYYRSVRCGPKTTKVYIGRGRLAEMAARMDEAERDRRRDQRDAWLAEQVQLGSANAALAELRGFANLLTHATLLLAGVHRHKNEWRRWKGECHGSTRKRSR